MRGSLRELLLIPNSGKVNKKRRYYSLKNALRRAVQDVITDKAPVIIHDVSRGVDVVSIRPTIGQVRIYLDSPRRFNQLWSRS